MKRLFKIILPVLIFSCLLLVSASAEEATVTGNDVNFRSGPGVAYTVIECLPRGTVVTVTDRSDSDWYGVSYNGYTGFISSYYLSLSSGSASTVVYEEQQPAAANESQGEAGVINAMYVRFRSGPSTSDSILAEYNTGTAVTVTGTSGDWTACVIYGQSGYVFSQYISYDTASSVSSAVTEEQPAETVQAAEPEPEPEPSYTVTASTGSDGYINGDYVRFRTGPGTEYSIIENYNRSTPVTVLGTSGSWTQCEIYGDTGFVFTQYVTVNETSSQSGSSTQESSGSTVQSTETKSGYISANSVRFRSGPSLSSNILGTYSKGTELVITGYSGDWTQCTLGGTSGYVYSDYVTEIKPSVSTGGTLGGQQVAQLALSFLGYPYAWGCESPEEGFDCSGLVYYCYGQFGYELHRVAQDMAWYDGIEVSADELQPGDLVCFYSTSDYIGHVGMYIGDGQFVHSSTGTTGVIISELFDGWYSTTDYVCKRIIY